MGNQLRIFITAVLTAAFVLPVSAATHAVTVNNFSFTPQALTVAPGDTVVWTNTQGSHNVHHSGNPSLFGNNVGSGWTYTFVFNLPVGVYNYVCEPHATMGMTGSVTVEALDVPSSPVTMAPSGYSLEQNYPNPFNSRTTIQFSVPQAGDARIRLMNVLGQEVATIFSGRVSAGTQRVAFNASDLPSGLYFYRLEVGGQAIGTRRMDFIK